MLNAEVDLEVLDTADNGDDLLRKIKAQQPDLVIADYDLPKNSRMFCFRRIYLEYKIPILLLISRDYVDEEFIFQAMKVGIYDYVKTGTHTLLPQFRQIRKEIMLKVRSVMDVKDFQHQLVNQNLPPNHLDRTVLGTGKKIPSDLPRSYIIIGASTGGTKAIEYILKRLKPNLNTVVLVALHLPGRFTSIFTSRVKSLTPLKVTEGKVGVSLDAGMLIIAPGGKNMVVTRQPGIGPKLMIGFSEEPADKYDCPSVNMLMESVAGYVGECTLGVILTGMGKDGTAGARAILRKGGDTIAQDEASSVIYGMAKSAIENGNIKKVLSLTQIPDYINRFAEYHRI